MTSGSRLLLITGASGFLGSRIVDLAIETGWKVRAFDRGPGTRHRDVETILGDIGDLALLRVACEGVTAVVHAAGLAHVFGRSADDSARFNEVNEVGTANVVETALATGISHIVLVSSVSVYGGNQGSRCDESATCSPQNPYAISKWRGELRAAEQVAKGKASLTILRFATIYGEGDRGNVAKLIRALNRGVFIWPGTGLNFKSLIYKDDAARACLRVLDRCVSGIEVFNVSDEPRSMSEIVSAICQALGRSSPRYRIPLFLFKTPEAILRRLGDPGRLAQRLQKFIRDDIYDGSKFETTFDFRPAVSFSEGLRREVEFLRAKAML